MNNKNIDEKEFKALCRYLSKIYFSYTGKKGLIRESQKPDQIGYTTPNGDIYLGYKHPLITNLPKEKQKFMVIGVFAHELLHQLLTDFEGKIKCAESYDDEFDANIYCLMHNLLEDPAIEYFADTLYGGVLLKALNFSISYVYEISSNIEDAGSPFEEFVSALVQFGDMGLLKGHFTADETQQIFAKAAPIFSAGIEEPDAGKRNLMAKDLVEISRPLWEAEKESVALLNLIKQALLDSACRENGQSYDSPNKKSSPDDKKKRRRNVTIRKVTKEEYDKMKSDNSEHQKDDGESDIEIIVCDEAEKEENKDPQNKNDAVNVPDETNTETKNSEEQSSDKTDNSAKSEDSQSKKQPKDSSSENETNPAAESQSSNDSNGEKGKDNETSSQNSKKTKNDGKETASENRQNKSESGEKTSDMENSVESNEMNSSDGESEKNSEIGKSQKWNPKDFSDSEADTGSMQEEDADNVIDFHEFDPDGMDVEEINANVQKGIDEMKEEQKDSSSNEGFEDIKLDGKSCPQYNGVRCCNERIKCNIDGLSDVYQELLTSLNPLIHSMYLSLKKIFNNDTEKKEYATSGKVNINRLCCGRKTTKVFERHLSPKQKSNLAIGICIDESGSMSGSSCRNAMEVAIILAEVFAKFDIPIYVMGFSESSGYHAYHKHYMTWKNTKASRINLLNISAGGSNFDGYAIRTMTRILKKKNAHHKILIMISDGQPACSFYHRRQSGLLDTKAAVREASKVAEVIGVGIETRDKNILASMYGKKYVNVSSAEQIKLLLPKKIKESINKW